MKSIVTRVLQDPLTGEMTLEGGALVLADQVLFFFFFLFIAGIQDISALAILLPCLFFVS